MYEGFWQDWQEAVEKFTLVDFRPDRNMIHVDAEADTGSRYEVMSAGMWLPRRDPHRMTYVVTVLSPWQAAWTLGWRTIHAPSYVAERLRNPVRKPDEVNGGDLAAVTVCAHLVTGWSLDESLVLAALMGREQ
jgi:hypothetical protein